MSERSEHAWGNLKVRDRVRWVSDGDVGSVVKIDEDGIDIAWDANGSDEADEFAWWEVRAEDLELVKNAPSDPVSPDHYKFPGGAEVIDISEHLTSNGGQVVQYVARATRLDGHIKGNALEDLRKASFFLSREIERLERDAP